MTIHRVTTPGTKGFFQWMQRALPKTYAGVKKELTRSGAPRLSGLGAVDPAATATTAAPSSSLTDTISQLATVAGQVYLTKEQLKSQQKVLDMQLQRARAGMPPADIDLDAYGMPKATVGVSLDDSTKKLLMYGGIGLALALMLGLIGGGRASRRAH